MSDEKGEIAHSEVRFGHIAVQEGFTTLDQLLAALKAQVEDDIAGEPTDCSEGFCANRAP
jgi:hypothetical protein